MMEAARTSETLVNFYQTTRCYNPEDSTLHTHRRENLKSYLADKKSDLALPYPVLLPQPSTCGVGSWLVSVTASGDRSPACQQMEKQIHTDQLQTN
jgi:hypothetical protein